ncbi:MAG: nucleotidyltransferase family protein [Saprospiraceae bacterium]|nr:nucleotidyltransferase family protein [Saprospiraceae bacterium]MDW8228376.1 nucleotidyltransferase family protein [Saprospiraceae bacterium]
MDKGLQTRVLEHLLPYQPTRVSIFGSYARGESGDNSDLDILVQFKERIGLLQLVQIEQELSDKLGIRVDLVTEGSLTNPLLKKYIEKDLIIIYG